MADVHFVVGPPGGTQRLPGHKVSNSCTIHSGGESWRELLWLQRDTAWEAQLCWDRQQPVLEKATCSGIICPWLLFVFSVKQHICWAKAVKLGILLCAVDE